MADDDRMDTSTSDDADNAPVTTAPKDTSQIDADASQADASKASDTPDVSAWYPQDWRDKVAQQLPETERDKAAKYLARKPTLVDAVRSAMAADSKISELTRDRVKLPSGKDDDPKEIEAYRKARGVPPDGKYAFEIPEDLGELRPIDMEVRDEFLEGANKLHWGQKDVDFTKDMFAAFKRAEVAQLVADAQSAGQRAQDQLRAEWGHDYRPNVNLTNRFVGTILADAGMTDPNERNGFLSKRFQDGTALGEHPIFVKAMAALAREAEGEGAMEITEGATTGNTNDRVEQIMDKMNTDPKEYARLQPELVMLMKRQQSMKK